MNIKEIANQIATKEGKKVEVTVGNVREILGIISDMTYEDSTVMDAIVKNGKNRAKKKKI